MSKQDDVEAEGYDDPPMTLWDHLAELRRRLVYCILAFLAASVGAWEYREELLAFLVTPFEMAWRENGIPGEPALHFASPAAAFTAYFKLSLLGGAAVAAPVIFWQIWMFIAPGLYAKEKRYVIPFVASASILFVGGGYFGWRMAFPVAFKYLLGLSGNLETIGVEVKPTVMMDDYIDFVTRMLLGFGIIFLIPLFILFLSIAGIINYLHLIRYGRWFIVAAAVLAAFITPPDATSMAMMAAPMVLLYGGSIGLAYLFGKPPTQAQRDAYKARSERIKREREEERERKRKEKLAEKRAREAEKKAEEAKKLAPERPATRPRKKKRPAKVAAPAAKKKRSKKKAQKQKVGKKKPPSD